jgi:hypothetical protein
VSILTLSLDSFSGLLVTMVTDGTTLIVGGVRLDVPLRVCEGAIGVAGSVGIHLA